MELKPLKVSEVNSYISRIISNDVLLYNISIEGEVSNCKYHSNGHVYLSLKDEKSRISAIIFEQYKNEIETVLEDGMKVAAKGYIDIYKRDGYCQLIIKEVKEIGRGALYEEFERLKKKLMKEGLFDSSHKKPIPPMPRRIGIATSPTGAAVRDLVTNIRRRNSTADIVIAPALVQGSGSEESIAEAVKTLDGMGLDLIIVGRGGGSIEDLMSFNSERVARAVFEAKTPVISAVGHETDTTIVDFVSDRRAPTPSTAAEIAVAGMNEIENILGNYARILTMSIGRKIDSAESSLRELKEHMIMGRPDKVLSKYELQLESCLSSIKSFEDKRIRDREAELSGLAERLEALSPLKTLARGYSVVLDENDNALKTAEGLKRGGKVKLIFSKGRAEAEITEAYTEEE